MQIYLIFHGKSCVFQNKNHNFFLLVIVVLTQCLFRTCVFKSSFGSHTEILHHVWTVSQFFVDGHTDIAANKFLMDVVLCFKCLFGWFAQTSTTQQTRNKSHTKNTKRTNHLINNINIMTNMQIRKTNIL